MKRYDVVSIFPDMFDALTGYGVTGRGRDKGDYELVVWNPRDFSSDQRRTVDDRPFGGGAGMVMMAEPIVRSIRAAKARQKSCGVGDPKTVALTPAGVPLTQRLAKTLTGMDGLILLAGRYEGIDQRVFDLEVDLEVSVGDYVVSGGELPAMVLLDSLIRLIPGVLNDENSIIEESHSDGLLEYPQYTRPEVFEGLSVPKVLLSGNHKDIDDWKKKEALEKTKLVRPDLLKAKPG